MHLLCRQSARVIAQRKNEKRLDLVEMNEREISKRDSFENKGALYARCIALNDLHFSTANPSS